MISNLVEEKHNNTRRKKRLEHIYQIIKEKDILILVVAFLLGRAVILSELTPFSLAYLVSVWLVKKERCRLVILVSLLGAVTISISNSLIIMISFLFFGFFVSLGVLV